MLNAVEKQTGLKFELVGSPTIPKFEEQLLQGEFDFAYMNPYQYLLSNQSQGYTSLVRDVGRSLYGIVVTRKDNALNSAHDLDGKVIAFPAPNAFGATLLLRAELKEKFHISIQPKYVRNHGSVYLNVLTGLADAGGGVQKTLSQQAEKVQKGLKVIYKTDSAAPHPIAAHRRVAQAVKDAVRNALLYLGETPAGRDILAEIPIVKIGQATDLDYEPLKQMGLDKYYVK